jgi:hypothetical protein
MCAGAPASLATYGAPGYAPAVLFECCPMNAWPCLCTSAMTVAGCDSFAPATAASYLVCLVSILRTCPARTRSCPLVADTASKLGTILLLAGACRCPSRWVECRSLLLAEPRGLRLAALGQQTVTENQA